MSKTAAYVRSIRTELRRNPVVTKDQVKLRFLGEDTDPDFDDAWNHATQTPVRSGPIMVGPMKFEERLRKELSQKCGACALDDEEDFERVVTTVMGVLQGARL